jgi:VanZ family protein
MLKNIFSLAAWLLLAFIVYATLSPLSARPSLVTAETTLSVAIERFGAYGLLGLLFGVAYARRLALVILIILGSVIGLELLQLVLADRDARLVDALEKLTGGIAGIGASRMLRPLCHHLGLREP